MAKKDTFESLVNQNLPDNLQESITAALLRAVLQYLKDAVIFNDNPPDGTVVQYSEDAQTWTVVFSSAHKYKRYSKDGGSTWTDELYLTTYLLDLLRDGVDEDGDTLKKLHLRQSASETAITNIQSAVGVSGDDLQSLQDLITMMENNPETVGEALSQKLDVDVFTDTVYGSNGIYNFIYGERNHVHTMDKITGLVAALAGKASISHQHTQAELEALGVLFSADLNNGTF